MRRKVDEQHFQGLLVCVREKKREGLRNIMNINLGQRGIFRSCSINNLLSNAVVDIFGIMGVDRYYSLFSQIMQYFYNTLYLIYAENNNHF